MYAFCIDVAGMDEALLNLDGMGNPGRDHTALSIIEIDLSQLATLEGSDLPGGEADELAGGKPPEDPRSTQRGGIRVATAAHRDGRERAWARDSGHCSTKPFPERCTR